MKTISFTHHALTAMRERELDLSWVERTIRNPDWIEPDPNDPEVVRSFARVPERGGRYLRVASVETQDTIRVVSTFLDRGARPK